MPIPYTGLRVLIIYESDDLSKYPPEQTSILYDGSFRKYLDSVTVLGSDGKTHEWRCWDKDISLHDVADLWKNAMSRPHPNLPWIVISNGATGFEGPLPLNTAETIELVQRYVPEKRGPNDHN